MKSFSFIFYWNIQTYWQLIPLLLQQPSIEGFPFISAPILRENEA